MDPISPVRDGLRLAVGQNVSYAEAVKRVDDSPRVSDLTGKLEERTRERMGFSKLGFIVFIDLVVADFSVEPLKEVEGRG